MKPAPESSFRVHDTSTEAVRDMFVRMLMSSRYGLSASEAKRVALALTPSDVHDPTEIPTYLAGYKPFQYRADEFSPIVLVDHDSDKYRQFSSDDTFRRVDVKNIANSLTIPEVDPQTSLTTYKVVDRAIASFIPDETESNATNPNYRPRMAAARRCRRAIDLDREIDVLGSGTDGLALNTSWAAAVRIALGAGQNWNGGINSDPILDLHNMIEASFQVITEFVMNHRLANAFVRHPKVKDHFRQFVGDGALQGAINQLGQSGKNPVDFAVPGVGVIKVTSSKVKNETTGALDYVMPNCVVGLTVPDAQFPLDGEEIATTYTFRRRGPSGTGYEAREFRVDNRGPLGGTMVVVSQADDNVFTANNAGGHINSGVFA